MPALVVQLVRNADGYRGDLSCVGILTPYTAKYVGGNGDPDTHEVWVGNSLVGHLRVWYGSGGHGKLAASEFIPFSGVRVEWVDRNTYWKIRREVNSAL